MKKKLVSFFTVATLLFTTPMAFAANGDIWKKSPEGLYKTAREMTKDKVARREVTKARANYYFEVDGHLFTYDQADQAYQKDNENFMATLKPADAVKPVPAAELAVASVSAINATQVEVSFNQMVSETNNLTFKFNGVPVAAADVSYADSKAILKVGTMVYGTEYTVTIADGDKLNDTQKFTFEITEPASLSIDQAVYNAQVGTDVKVKYLVKDDQNKPVEGAEVFVRAEKYFATGGGEIAATEETVRTDKDGIATAVIRRSDSTTTGVPQGVTAYLVAKPTIRNTEVKIHWSLSATGLVLVDDLSAKDLGNGSYRDFAITVKNTNGTAKVTGNLFVSIGKDPAGVGNTQLYVRDLSVADENAKNAWKPQGKAGLALVGGIYKLELDTGVYLNNNVTKEGKVQFRMVEIGDPQKDVKVVPTFYTTKNDEARPMKDEDPSAVGGSTTFKPQVATFELKPVNDLTQVAIDAAPLAQTVEEKEKNQYKLYELSVSDQFGNPYRGEIKIADYKRVDKNTGTHVTAVNAKFKADTNGDKTYDVATADLKNVETLDLAYAADFGKDDKNNDSKMLLSIFDGTKEDDSQLAVWADNSLATGSEEDQIDPDEKFIKGELLQFRDRTISNIEMAPVKGNETIKSGELEFVAKIFDQFGDGMLPGNNFDFTVAKKDGGAVEADETNFVVEASNTKASDPKAYNTTNLVAPGGNAIFNLNNVDDNVIQLKLKVKGVNTAHGAWNLITFKQEAVGVAYDGTQAAGKTEFNVKADAGYVKMGLEVDATGKADMDQSDVFTADAADEVTFTYQKLDEANAALGEGAETVSITLKNTGVKDLDVEVNGNTKTLKAGATETYTDRLVAGEFVVKVQGDGSRNFVEYSATSAELANADAKATVYFIDGAIPATENQYNGDVVANVKAQKYIVMSTALGYRQVKYNDVGFAIKTLKVDGTKMPNEAAFTPLVKAGMKAKASVDGATNLTLELEN